MKQVKACARGLLPGERGAPESGRAPALALPSPSPGAAVGFRARWAESQRLRLPAPFPWGASEDLPGMGWAMGGSESLIPVARGHSSGQCPQPSDRPVGSCPVRSLGQVGIPSSLGDLVSLDEFKGLPNILGNPEKSCRGYSEESLEIVPYCPFRWTFIGDPCRNWLSSPPI